GAVITPAVTVAVQDAFGNLVTTDTSTIHMVISVGPGGSMLSGTTSRQAVGGVATFDDLKIDQAGTGYKLAAATGAQFTALSAAFDLTSGSRPPTPLSSMPPRTATIAGAHINPAVTVAVEDADNHVVTTDHSMVSVQLSNGTNLFGTLSVPAVGG